jgi:carboxymethylenebutenolidase
MSHRTVLLTTQDGPCSCTVFVPTRPGRFPPLVFAHDGFGPRESQYGMAARIAEWGYVVALPDLYHRVGSILELTTPPAPDVKTLAPRVIADLELRGQFRQRYFVSASQPAHVETDLGAALDYLASCPEVRPGRAGVVGYCLGGHVALRAAAIFGERLAAVACLHGGSIVTDAPDSPHLGASKIAARVLVVGAVEDPSFSEQVQSQLSQAFRAAGVEHDLAQYPARHGFSVADMPTYDRAASERQFEAVAELFASTL